MAEPSNSQCLCGGVRFIIVSSPLDAVACYCADCRKANGVSGRMTAYFTQQSIKLESPDDLISLFTYTDKASGKLKDKIFCKICGVTICTAPHGLGNMSFWDGPQCIKRDDATPKPTSATIDEEVIKSDPGEETVQRCE
ncbi:Mss4-like protein [Podospora fimiseda]|uniref:Mss4-like protein n=1 Tax=Podospora fimiseda TaxID=252190 RepID=A0AAN7BJY6_9PEZI|nr:Mss4-like protein [Podospora fimiseda]